MAIAVVALRREPQGDSLRSLYCHGVFDDQVTRFASLLDALCARGRFVDSATCVAMLRGRHPIEGVNFHLSFDDGFKNVLINAAPLLVGRGIPATVFVPSAWVGAGVAGAREYGLTRLGLAAPVELLDWRDCAALAQCGFTVASHGRTHVRLARLDPQTLSDEVGGSRREIEDRLGRPCAHFAWPYGRRSDVDAVALDAVQRAGYEACFGAFRGRIVPGVTEPLSIPRHHFEAGWPIAHTLVFASGAIGESD